MNSSAANMNVSALLNLGAKTKFDQREMEPRQSEDTFKKHMSNEVSNVNDGPAVASDVRSKNAERERNDRPPTNADKVEAKPETSAPASTDSAEPSQSQKAMSASGSDQDTEDRSPEGETAQRLESDHPGHNAVDSTAPLVSPLYEGGDVHVQSSGEIVIDVPVDATVSLESLADAVTNNSDSLTQKNETISATLNELVDELAPIEAEVGEALAAMAPPSAMASTTDARALGAASAAEVSAAGAGAINTGVVNERRSAQALAAGPLTGGSEAAEDIESFAPLVDSRSTGLEAKSTGSKTVELMQLADNMPRPNQQTLNQQAVTAVTAAAQELAKDGSAKGDQSGSLREVSPLVAATQRSASRPINVQQGNAQFTMPSQMKAGQPQWQTAVAERVAIMATQRITSAEIQLDPPELGQLQVRVTLNQEQASVSFASQHAVVREALDQTAQKLRDMFDAEGLNLVDVDVSDQSFQQQGEGGNGGSGQGGADGEPDDATEAPIRVKMAQGLVDHFV